MTAEVAIFNKSAIALAADSAISTAGSAGVKIFNTVNKLFALSKYHPVGIMIYGNAQMLGVPWELIIKSYRHQLKDVNFPRLDGFAEDFRKYLVKTPLFSQKARDDYFEYAIAYAVHDIKRNLDQAISEGGNIRPDERNLLVQNKLKWLLADVQKFPTLISDELPTNVNEKADQLIEKVGKEILKETNLEADRWPEICQLVKLTLVKHYFVSLSGVVIAGYGEHDYFPSIRSYHIDGVLGDILKFSTVNSIDVSDHPPSGIVPFAEALNVVNSFIFGIDQAFEQLFKTSQSKLTKSLCDHIRSRSFDPADRQQLVQDVERLFAENETSLGDMFQRLQKQSFSGPVVDIVTHLPKDELAAMAEALVNLSSFKRKFSTGAETVGGPIDVAVISKNDGFIWIKRKHYFKPELNHHFTTQYFEADKRSHG